MLVGCGTVTFRTYPLEEALERVKRAGFEYVEPQATPPFCPHIDVDNDDPKAFRELVKSYGFKGATALWCTHGAIIPDDKSVEYGKKCLRWARAADIPVVNIGDGFAPEGMSEAEAWELLRSRLLEILKVAEECKVYLAIEPHGTFSLTSEGLKRILSISDSEWLCINYDTANIHRAAYVESRGDEFEWKMASEAEDEVEVLRQIVDRVRHVHVKDIKGNECVALGQGDVNIAGCLQVLKESGYEGVLSLETEGDFDAEEGQKLIVESHRYLTRVLAEIL